MGFGGSAEEAQRGVDQVICGFQPAETDTLGLRLLRLWEENETWRD